MKLQDFKAYLENKLDEAKANLIYQDAMQPVFAYVKDGKIEEMNLTLSDEDKDKEIYQIRELCKSASVEFAAIVCDCYTKTDEPEKLEALDGQDLKNVEGSIECLMIFLYTRDGGINTRTLPYKKQAEQKYWFSDKGWEETKMQKRSVLSRILGKPQEESRFSNPFTV